MSVISTNPNIHVVGTVVAAVLDDPLSALEDKENFGTRYVGGLHNLSRNDKMAWVRSRENPLRIIESCTGREEIWFPARFGHHTYISIGIDGGITSHVKSGKIVPAIQCVLHNTKAGRTRLLDIWYKDGLIHRHSYGMSYRPVNVGAPAEELVIPNGPAVEAGSAFLYTPNSEYLTGIFFRNLYEYWTDGKWEKTIADYCGFYFNNPRLNNDRIRDKANAWISKNCLGGFYPLEEQMFGDEEEEVMFIADICSRG
jgi:hypothetical protein